MFKLRITADIGVEVWLPIEGYQGLYEVSNIGRVKSLNYRHTGNEKVLQPMSNGKGYWQVGLYKYNIRRCIFIHRLVAEAFLPNPQNLPQINHKDENPKNNRVENLEFCTAKYNVNYGSHNQRVAKAFSKKVLQFDITGNLIKEWPSASEVERQIGVYSTHICDCCNGKRKTACGYKWQYA